MVVFGTLLWGLTYRKTASKTKMGDSRPRVLLKRHCEGDDNPGQQGDKR